ncbi:MAG: hypothetical protein ACLRZO_13355, partial [Eggerthella lenta]
MPEALTIATEYIAFKNKQRFLLLTFISNKKRCYDKLLLPDAFRTCAAPISPTARNSGILSQPYH